MINYKQLNKEITLRKWERIHNKTIDEFTCYYSPSEGHKLCTHPTHCILNNELQRLRESIESKKEEVKYLEEIYEDAINLKRENRDMGYDMFFVGFSPKQNRIKRNILKRSIREDYKKLNHLKTKKGGY